MKEKNLNWVRLGLIFSVAATLRLVYAFYLQKYFSGDYRFITADTSSYMDSFLNWVNHGRYCFDLETRDSCFYRLPTYSFFLGIQKYFLGGYYWVSVAVLQALLDAGSCCLAVLIAKKINIKKLGQMLIAFLFVFYPFTIFWVPIQGPEIVGNFLVLLAIYIMFCMENEWLAIFLSGLSLVLAVLTKQYIAALIPAMIVFLMARSTVGKFLRNLALFAGVFIIGYSPWVLRNLINYGEPAILMGATTGVKGCMPDYINAMFFVSLYYENPGSELFNIARNGKLSLPNDVFSHVHRDEINQAVSDAYRCGPSFRVWRGERSVRNTDDCEQLVAEEFTRLTQKAKAEMPFIDYYSIGLESFAKGFYKFSYIESTGTPLVQSVLFGYRGILIVIGVLAIFFAAERRQFALVLGGLIFWFSTLFVLSFVYRHVEMRYLLMADSVMLICSGLAISRVIECLKVRLSQSSTRGI